MSDSYEYKVGRGKDCHLVVNNPFVSRDHTRIRWNGTVWVLQDMGSANGTFLNDSVEPLSSEIEHLLSMESVVHFSRYSKLIPSPLEKTRGSVSFRSSRQMCVFDLR